MRRSAKVGDRFERLTVTEILGPTGRGTMVRAVCDCGTAWEGFGYRLTGGHVTSCGCFRKERCTELGRLAGGRGRDGAPSKVSALVNGHVIGRLMLLEPVVESTNDSSKVWYCKCTCGAVCKIPAGRLAYGKARSCGCAATDHLERVVERARLTLDTWKKDYAERVAAKQGTWTGELLDRGAGLEESWNETKRIKLRNEQRRKGELEDEQKDDD